LIPQQQRCSEFHLLVFLGPVIFYLSILAQSARRLLIGERELGPVAVEHRMVGQGQLSPKRNHLYLALQKQRLDRQANEALQAKPCHQSQLRQVAEDHALRGRTELRDDAGLYHLLESGGLDPRARIFHIQRALQLHASE
jgi:hypothetical protein